MEIFGNRLNDTIQNSRHQLFFQGEMTQLTYTSYENCKRCLQRKSKELDKIWPSQKYRNSKTATIEEQKEAAIESAVNEEVAEEQVAKEEKSH